MMKFLLIKELFDLPVFQIASPCDESKD